MSWKSNRKFSPVLYLSWNESIGAALCCVLWRNMGSQAYRSFHHLLPSLLLWHLSSSLYLTYPFGHSRLRSFLGPLQIILFDKQQDWLQSLERGWIYRLVLSKSSCLCWRNKGDGTLNDSILFVGWQAMRMVLGFFAEIMLGRHL